MFEKLFTHLAHALSMALHPLVLPIYLLVVLFTRTAFGMFPVGLKWYLAVVVLLGGVVVPMVAVGVMRLVGKLDNLALQQPAERLRPLIIGAAAYVVAALAIAHIPQVIFLRKFLLAVACCELMCFLVTMRWKISLHLTGMGSAVALLAVLNVLGLPNLFSVLLWAILLAGLLASARLYLGYHRPLQLLAGFLGGYAITWLAMIAL